MDHNDPNHWGGYVGAPVQNTWIPPPLKKRALSESDNEEIYSEESSKERYDLASTDRNSRGENDSCQLMSRKRRRGVIEKKRRDKINCSLAELKRLVPTAYEKQGSAKLEKAEILQLTVDHLKALPGKGTDSLAYDPQRFAMDYHIIGFRECAAEVARYLVTVEGMDIQDPLRLRLMSHLQCFIAQRELTAKSGPTSNWPACNYQTPISYPPPPTSTSIPYLQNYSAQSASSSNTYSSSLPPTIPLEHLCGSSSNPVQSTSTLTSHDNHNMRHDMQETSPQHHYQTTHDAQQNTIYTDLSSNTHRTTPTANTSYSQIQYPPLSTEAYTPHSNASSVPYNGNSMKPYRPWGAEMAY